MKISIISSNPGDPATAVASVCLNLKCQYEQFGSYCYLIFQETIFTLLPGILGQVAFAFILPFRNDLQAMDVLDISPGDGLWIRLFYMLHRSKRLPLFVARSHGLEHMAHEARLAEATSGTLKLSWKYPFYHGGYRLWLVKKYLQKSDLILVLNNKDKFYITSNFAVRPDRIKTIDNGIPDYFLHRKIKFSEVVCRRVALIGSFLPIKGIQYSVPALDKLIKRNPNLELGFFGTGPSRSEIVGRFSEECRSNVVEVVEKYAHAELPDLISGYDVLLFPSLSEGFGMAALEGMACGLALVATNICGIAERLEDGKNALLIPPRNVEAIQKAVQQLIDDPSLLLRIRLAGYELAQNFSWERIAKDTLALYEEGVARKARETNR